MRVMTVSATCLDVPWLTAQEMQAVRACASVRKPEPTRRATQICGFAEFVFGMPWACRKVWFGSVQRRLLGVRPEPGADMTPRACQHAVQRRGKSGLQATFVAMLAFAT